MNAGSVPAVDSSFSPLLREAGQTDGARKTDRMRPILGPKEAFIPNRKV